MIDEKTRLLILGSFPSTASLAAQQYYAFSRNQFWRLISGVINADLVAMTYENRLQTLLQHGIGLWDIYHECVRQGSLDSAIREGKFNDFSQLKQDFPHLQTLAFNGKTAARIKTYFERQHFKTLQLPSSSPAFAAMGFDEKLTVWRQLLSQANMD